MKTCEICNLNTHSPAAQDMADLVWAMLKRVDGLPNRRETEWGTKPGVASWHALIASWRSMTWPLLKLRG